MNSLMIDIETLSTRPDACVISIGAAVFDDREVIESAGWGIISKDWHGHIDPATVSWWMSQAESKSGITDFNFKGIYSDFAVAFELKSFIAKYNCTEVWANSPQFDLVILESWWRRLDKAGNFPVHYKQPRDLRTLVAEAKRLGHDPYEGLPTFVAHDPVEDAVHQARVVIQARKQIGGRL